MSKVAVADTNIAVLILFFIHSLLCKNKRLGLLSPKGNEFRDFAFIDDFPSDYALPRKTKRWIDYAPPVIAYPFAKF